MRRPARLARLLAAGIAALAASAPAGPACAAPEAPPAYAARHILVSFKGARTASRSEPGSEAKRTKDEARALATQIAADLKKPGTDFVAAVAMHTDDKATLPQDGFLGIFGPGRMVPAFEAAVTGLKEGEVSGVVETEFGFHVIQRLSLADGIAANDRYTAFVVGAVFPWAGVAQPGPTPPKGTKEQALERAKKAAESLRSGGRPEDWPAEWDARALRQGWMILALGRGAVLANPDAKPLIDAAFALAPGQTSEPVEAAFGWVVVRRIPYFRTRVQHLLVMHAKSMRVPAGITRTKEEAKARAEEALKKVRADPASWEKVVGEYSDDASNAKTAGDLGLAEPGARMVREFDEGIARTAPGGFSELVETPFGYHVIHRVD
jgi:parvulin-like peptidyl-prolyl isomerase